MKKTVVISILLISATATINYSYKNISFGQPPKAKHEKSVTYNIGWWAYQDALTVDAFRVEIVESKLNLFNSKSIISYTIGGKLTSEKGWHSTISEVHISERINADTTLKYDRIIEITPIVEYKRNKSQDDGIEKFHFKNEHVIVSNHWGKNRIKLVCGPKEQIIELFQRK